MDFDSQPDLLTAHFEYVGRATTGPGIVTAENLKLGRRTSLLQLTLWQGGLSPEAPFLTPSSRRIVLAYATYTSLAAAKGLSVPTGYEITPAAALPSPPDVTALMRQGADEDWREEAASGAPGQLSLERWQFYVPRGEPSEPGVLSMWIRLRSGENITQKALPFALDSFPHTIHSYIVAPELRKQLKPPNHASAKTTTTGPSSDDDSTPILTLLSALVSGENGAVKPGTEFWTPTLVMNCEIKKKLPHEGVEWLHARVTGKQIKDGRADMEMVLRDIEGALVAQAQQVYMIVSSENNTKQGSKASL